MDLRNSENMFTALSVRMSEYYGQLTYHQAVRLRQHSHMTSFIAAATDSTRSLGSRAALSPCATREDKQYFN